MTVSTTIASQTFPGNGGQSFPCDFRIFDDTNVEVQLVKDADGTTSTLALNTDYTISGAGGATGFTLATVNPVATGYTLTVERVLPYDQPTDFTNQGSFFPSMHEDMADRLEMQIQQVAGRTSRSLIASLATGNYDLGGKTISGSADAVGPTDLTTQQQVDTKVAAAATGSFGSNIALLTDLASTATGKGAALVGYLTGTVKSFLDSLATSVGSSLIGFIQQGTGALLRTLQDKFRERPRTPQDYGAIGDDATDDTAAVQAWVTACGTYGYKGYVPAVASGYKLTAPIVVSSGFSMVGDGVEPNVGTLATTGVNTRGRGSWFHFAHAGIGFNIDGGANGRSGVRIAHIGTYRDQPAPTGGAYTPGAFDYDIVANTVDCTIEDVMLLNPTKAVSHTNGGYGRLTIRGLRGQPLSIGLNVSESYDTGRVRDVHWWPFWTNDTGVRDYMRLNGIAFNIARWDNPVIDNCFSLGYAYFCKLIQNANGHVNKLVMTNCDADVGGGLLFIDASVSGATVQMANCRTQGQNTGAVPANFANVQINGSNCRLVMTNVELRYPQANCVRVQGSGNNVSMSNMTLGAWNQVGSTYRAVEAATSGNIITLHNRPVISENGVSSTPYYNEASGATVSAPLSSGSSSITTDASGFATITHNSGNAPRRAFVVVSGAAFYFIQPTGSFTATTFDVQVRTTAGAAAASVTLTAYWRLEF